MTRSHILVVDDNAGVTEVMARILRDGYDVTTSTEAREAMSLLERREFDVVLADVRMPGATGFDLLAAVRRRRAAPTSVVLMTAFASVPDAVKAMRQGAFDYVAKPIEADEVLLVVARAVRERARRAAGDAAGDRVDTGFHEAVVAARRRASRAYLVALMRQHEGNVTRAAAQAGMARESLHRLLKQYGVHSTGFKTQAG
jgi:DNA-binding NtrC family response regulator